MLKNLGNIILFGITIIILVSIIIQPSKGEKLANEIISEKIYTNNLNGLLKDKLNYFLKGSKYENKWQINSSLDKTKINIYIIIPKNNLKRFSGNCCYLGYDNIIICDYNFLTTFLKKQLDKSFLKRAKENSVPLTDIFTTWVLGHEIGHILLNHKGSSFQKTSFQKMASNLTIDQKKEVDADLFSIEKIVSNKKNQNELTDMLLSILNSEIKKKSKTNTEYYGVGILYDFYSQPAIEYSNSDSHPEYIIRAVRNLEMIGKMTDDKGLNISLKKLSEHFREK